MKKRCIWNWDKKKKIECLDEKRKRSRFFVVLSFWGGIVIEIGIPIIILIVLLLDAIINKHMPFQNAMFSTGIQFIVLLPFMSFWEYIVYTQIYNDMISILFLYILYLKDNFFHDKNHKKILLSYVRMRERMKDASGQEKRAYGKLRRPSLLFWQV